MGLVFNQPNLRPRSDRKITTQMEHDGSVLASIGSKFRAKVNEMQHALFIESIPPEQQRRLLTFSHEISGLYADLVHHILQSSLGRLDSSMVAWDARKSGTTAKRSHKESYLRSAKSNSQSSSSSRSSSTSSSSAANSSPAPKRKALSDEHYGDAVDVCSPTENNYREVPKRMVNDPGQPNGKDTESSAQSLTNPRHCESQSSPPKETVGDTTTPVLSTHDSYAPSYNSNNSPPGDPVECYIAIEEPYDMADNPVPDRDLIESNMSPAQDKVIDTAGSEKSYNAAQQKPKVFVGIDDDLSFYSSMDIDVGGVAFQNLATALVYFIGAAYGRNDARSYNRASWLLLARTPIDAETKMQAIINPIPKPWLQDKVPSLAAAVISAAEQRSSAFALKLSRIPPDVQEVLHAGFNTFLTTGSSTNRLPIVAGGNALGIAIREYVKKRPQPIAPLHNLLLNTFRSDAEFLLLTDSQGRGITGLSPTIVETVTGMYAYSFRKRHKSAAHILCHHSKIAHVAAIAVCVGTNHAQDSLDYIKSKFNDLLRKIREQTKSLVVLVGPPPRTDQFANRVPQMVTTIRQVVASQQDCIFIDLLESMGYQSRRRCIAKDGYHLTKTGKLRLITVLLEYLPQLRLRYHD